MRSPNSSFLTNKRYWKETYCWTSFHYLDLLRGPSTLSSNVHLLVSRFLTLAVHIICDFWDIQLLPLTGVLPSCIWRLPHQLAPLLTLFLRIDLFTSSTVNL